jgi:hypothetical protein
MEITLITITSLVLLFQFLLDFLIETRRTKIIVGIIIVIFGLITLWFTFYLQKSDITDSEEKHRKEILEQQYRFNKLDSVNVILNSELKLRNEDISAIRRQNDSLKLQLFQLNEKQEKSLVISQISAEEVSRSRVALENMGYKQVSRGISQFDKIQMVKILKRYKKASVTLITLTGDSEASQFAIQIKEVFEAAEWKVSDISYRLYFQPINGIVIQVKSEKYPIRADGIFEAFKVLNIVAAGTKNAHLEEDEVELIIGTK